MKSSEYSIYITFCTDQIMNKTLQTFYTCSNTMLPSRTPTHPTCIQTPPTLLAMEVNLSILQLPLYRRCPLRFIKALHVHICHHLIQKFMFSSLQNNTRAHTNTQILTRRPEMNVIFKDLPAVFQVSFLRMTNKFPCPCNELWKYKISQVKLDVFQEFCSALILRRSCCCLALSFLFS